MLPKSNQLYSRRVAVIVGIDRYQKWPNLAGARSDGQRMAKYLRSSGFDDVREVYDGEATRSNLLSVLGTQLGESVDEESLVLIYFAGHGQTDQADQAQPAAVCPEG